MASARSLLSEENFLCSVCLCPFTKPASIPCGHTFCLDCITSFWDTVGTIFQCPLCKERFNCRPVLRVNTVMDELSTKFRDTDQKRNAGEAAPGQAGSVLCNMCTGVTLPASKSCLVCFMSYCDTHLKPHHNIPALRKHKLIDPVENLESRICETHAEPLELFCVSDQMFLCQSCKGKDHKNHKMVPVEEVAQTRRAQLGVEKEDADRMIQVCQKKIQEIQNSRDGSRVEAAKTQSLCVHIMNAIVDYVKRSQAELTGAIEAKQHNTEKEAEGFIAELEAEIMQIKQRKLQLDRVSQRNDPHIFLQNLISLTITQPPMKDWSNVTLNTDHGTVQEAIATLQATVTRDVSMLCDPDWKEKQRYAVDITLDPDTANPHLILSADGKEVTHKDKRANLPNNSARFDNVFNVLAKEGFSSGRFYYEVQVKNKAQWKLGVAYQSVNRKVDIRLSPKYGYWTVWLKKGGAFTANTDAPTNLPIREMLHKVGVFVDYDEGRVSFYDVDARAHIFSFTKYYFTEKLFPFFNPSSNDGGKNSAPLIITPVTSSS